MFEKQPLQVVQLAVLGEPLDGGDLFALAARRQHDTAMDRRAAEQHCAGAAVAGFAAALGAGHAKPFPKRVKQQRREKDSAKAVG